ncbi:MAG: hypothetical protein ACK46X_21330 [Candidatus Sericytochromatia bacterium]
MFTRVDELQERVERLEAVLAELLKVGDLPENQAAGLLKRLQAPIQPE